jgi:hypothetical protein
MNHNRCAKLIDLALDGIDMCIMMYCWRLDSRTNAKTVCDVCDNHTESVFMSRFTAKDVTPIQHTTTACVHVIIL